ncbi:MULTISPECIES: hypothetical protein [Lysinibacillus]|uniref:hypothetical protein n=1 Tax=Lysinibacillus TaxID=400634 RepID=UPI0004D67B1E|nr:MULTISPECIES: hypothetical protein [Lysinibacillus]AJK88516.1 hypothetical protein HR49_15940 [Lysinibacillus fusiformis]KHK53969.1 hypothetical protein PI85_07055 [Lysinibacillus sp. A1]MEE3809081.1 hypothetical protein [Lysinibacillus fusiformis]
MAILECRINKYRLIKEIPAWGKLLKLQKKLGMHCDYSNKEIQNYLLSHPNDTVVRFKIIQCEIQYDDFLLYLKTLKTKKSKADLSRYRSMCKYINTIYMDIYNSTKEIESSEINKIIEEFENDISEIYRKETVQ